MFTRESCTISHILRNAKKQRAGENRLESSWTNFSSCSFSSVGSRVKPSGFDTRFGEDEYESAGGDCVSTKKKIQPKALNTIYNKLMTVVNNATYVQLIDIETCQ